MPRQRPHRGADDLLQQLLAERYLLKDGQGRVIEDARQMVERVARASAAPEARFGASPSMVRAVAQQFADAMQRRVFLPNSPTLMNAGRPAGLLSACFVLGIEDSVEGIFDAVKLTALVQKAGGGTGFAFDTLRPTGDYVASSGGVTSGPISFWRVFAEAMKAIQQGAHRRGAGMAMLSIEHPDILNFIAAKQNPGDFANFNISVKIPDSFMATLRSEPDTPHAVTNNRTGQRYLIPRPLGTRAYGLSDLLPVGRSGEQCYTVREVWNLIVANAHASGEPGVCFIDRINRDNPTPALGRITATNPCGEQPLFAGESCCLGSVDVSKFVLRNEKDMDWAALGDVVKLGVRFLDNVIDANYYPAPQIQEATLGNRKIGLGVMGVADALVTMGIRYDSDEAVRFARRMSQFIQQTAHAASHELAEKRGSFPNWPGSVWDTEHHRPMRNASCTTVAPTGTLSILAECSAGIEPIHSLAYRRRALDGREFIQVHPLLERIGRREGWMNDVVREALLEAAPATEVKAIPRHLANALVTAHQVAPEWHVRMQAAFQEHTDNAVSKTVNLPANATVQDVDRVFRLAFELGCKGTTVYRDGSRQGQTLSRARDAQASHTTVSIAPRPRDRVTTGRTFKFRMGCGTLFVTVNRDEAGLCEVFANLGKAGGCPSQSEATCRAVSVALRSGVEPRELIEQLRGIRCLSTARARKNGDDVNVLSCPDAIARAIEEGMGASTQSTPVPRNACPDCGAQLRKQEGCLVCTCGYSKCG
jgi:ribonucleoside-diphosphate reductase alpha chain